MGDCDSGSALRRSAWAPWRREWHLDGCKWLTVTSALLPEHKSALVRLLPSSSLLRVTGLEGDGGLRAAAARRLAGLAADTELQKVSITSMLSAMLLLGGVDYSWHLAPSVGHSNRIAHLEEATSGCEAAPYVLVDVELLTTPASAAKVDGLLACAPRRGAFVALTTRPLVRGQSSWLNQALLPRMRARHNMSLDVISSASLRRASFCDCLSARCCAGDGAPLLFFVRDDALLSIEPSTTRPRPNRHPSRWAHERADGAAAHAGVVMAADMNYLRANLRTFELLAAQSRRLPLSLVSPNATHARRAVVDAMRRVAPSGAKGGAAGGGAAGSGADGGGAAGGGEMGVEARELWLPQGALPAFTRSEYGFRLHKLPALLQSAYELSIYLDIDVSLCSRSVLAELIELSHERRGADLFVMREGRRADGVDYVHGGVLLYRATPLARAMLRTWLRRYLVTYATLVDARSGRVRSSAYEQPALTETVEAAQLVLPESVHVLPTELLARVHTGQVPLYLRRAARREPAAPLAHINGLKGAEKELYRRLVRDASCGGRGDD